MAKVHRGGRKPDTTKERYPSGQPKPVNNDFGPTEQRLKREIASGGRSKDDAQVLSRIFAKLSAANIGQEAIWRGKTKASVVKSGIIDQDELRLALAFTDGPQPRVSLSAMDVLLSRQIVSRDQFAAKDCVASWCADMAGHRPRLECGTRLTRLQR